MKSERKGRGESREGGRGGGRGALFVAAIKNAGEGCSDFKVERGGEFEKGAGSRRRESWHAGHTPEPVAAVENHEHKGEKHTLNLPATSSTPFLGP